MLRNRLALALAAVLLVPALAWAALTGASHVYSLVTTDDVTVGDDLVVTDDASVGGDLTVTGTLGVTGTIGDFVAAQIPFGRTFTLSSGAATKNVSECSSILFLTAAIDGTGTTTAKVAKTGATFTVDDASGSSSSAGYAVGICTPD